MDVFGENGRVLWRGEHPFNENEMEAGRKTEYDQGPGHASEARRYRSRHDQHEGYGHPIENSSEYVMPATRPEVLKRGSGEWMVEHWGPGRWAGAKAHENNTIERNGDHDSQNRAHAHGERVEKLLRHRQHRHGVLIEWGPYSGVIDGVKYVGQDIISSEQTKTLCQPTYPGRRPRRVRHDGFWGPIPTVP